MYFVSYTLPSTHFSGYGEVRRKSFSDDLAEFTERGGKLAEELTPDEHEVLEKIMAHQDRVMRIDHFENFA
jgi:hypothetical protein